MYSLSSLNGTVESTNVSDKQMISTENRKRKETKA